MKDYILITAARNEARYIENTLRSVIAQTITPMRWLIVNNGSTDDTAAIIDKYAAGHDFIQPLNLESDTERSFGAKAHAINYAYRQVAGLPFATVGILDADITFEPDYYARLLPHFAQNPRLGISGGFVIDIIDGKPTRRQLSTEWSVRGPVQTFRRECFEAIDGYRALKYGGIDAIAELSARYNGWQVQTIIDIEAFHHRATGTETRSFIQAHFRVGKQNYVNGYAPLFMLLRCLKRLPKTPVITGASAMMAGYLAAMFQREPPAIPPELVKHLRREQRERIFG